MKPLLRKRRTSGPCGSAKERNRILVWIVIVAASVGMAFAPSSIREKSLVIHLLEKLIGSLDDPGRSNGSTLLSRSRRE